MARSPDAGVFSLKAARKASTRFMGMKSKTDAPIKECFGA